MSEERYEKRELKEFSIKEVVKKIEQEIGYEKWQKRCQTEKKMYSIELLTGKNHTKLI